MNASLLSMEFYRRPDTAGIARELLGKVIITDIGGIQSSGRIVETEAYLGAGDRACHAYNYRRTNRTETMYLPGGYAYVYMCYGIHHLFNVVTHVENEPHAVLVRAVEPLEGLEIMMKRRDKLKFLPSLTAGPGVLSKALGISRDHSGQSLSGPVIRLEDQGFEIKPSEIIASPRVGVDYAGEDALLPLRFRIKDNPFTSPAR